MHPLEYTAVHLLLHLLLFVSSCSKLYRKIFGKHSCSKAATEALLGMNLVRLWRAGHELNGVPLNSYAEDLRPLTVHWPDLE